MKAGSLLDVKLGNDSLLFLPSNATIQPATTLLHFGNKPSVFTQYLLRYILTPAQAMQIKANGIKYTRTHLQGDMATDLKFSEGETEKTKKSANCVYY
jgi:hypothetical protein